MPTHHSGTSRETLALNTFIKLTRGTESLMARLARRGTHSPLTESQFGVLETLYHLGPMCQNELAGKLLKSGGNITMVIDNLEKQQLVQRQRDPDDRRMSVVSLTEAGRELITRIFPQHLQSIVDELSVLTPQEQDALGQLCRKLGKAGKD